VVKMTTSIDNLHEYLNWWCASMSNRHFVDIFGGICSSATRWGCRRSRSARSRSEVIVRFGQKATSLPPRARRQIVFSRGHFALVMVKISKYSNIRISNIREGSNIRRSNIRFKYSTIEYSVQVFEYVEYSGDRIAISPLPPEMSEFNFQIHKFKADTFTNNTDKTKA